MTSTMLVENPVAITTDDSSRSTAGPVRKVLHVMNGEVYGGAERALDHLAMHLGRFGFQPAFACIKPRLFPTARHAQQTPLYEVPMRHKFDLRPVARLVRIIRREGFSLVYAHTARSAMVASLAARIAGVPMVYHVQSPTSRDTANPWKNRINAAVERFSLRRVSALMAVSGSMAKHVRDQGYAEEIISVIPNGVPCREPVPARTASKAEWTLGIVALIRPRKGIETLLRAVALLRGQGLPVRLRATGPFETEQYEHKVKALTHQLGLDEAVDFTGFTRDVDSELAQMDLFVLPSLFGEGLPLVVLEAMAAGVPVLASRVEGNPEAIRDGQDGLIFEPGDHEGLAAAAKRIITGQIDWHALRASALQRHADLYSDIKMAEGVARVYRQVLDKTP